MGKRSAKVGKFKKSPRDFYATPEEKIHFLLPHLPPKIKFIEPTAGRAHFILGMERHGHKCVEAYDIKPQHRHKWNGVIKQADVLDQNWKPRRKHDFIITNPPFSRHLLHPMIIRFSDISPTWLLFDADWYWTQQATEFRDRIVKIVVVGRIKWFAKSDNTGVDNYSFYLFDKPRRNRVAKIYPYEFEPLDIAGKYA